MKQGKPEGKVEIYRTTNYYASLIHSPNLGSLFSRSVMFFRAQLNSFTLKVEAAVYPATSLQV